MAAAPAEAPGAAAAFPWDDVMAVGLTVLRLSPADLWRTTPREFAAALRPFPGLGGDAPRRGELERLMQRFPDRR